MMDLSETKMTAPITFLKYGVVTNDGHYDYITWFDNLKDAKKDYLEKLSIRSDKPLLIKNLNAVVTINIEE
jgi:hypothetical protein